MCMNTNSVCYNWLCYFQGVHGPSGPPGAKGIAGEPVSLLFIYINCGYIFENQPHYQIPSMVMFFLCVFLLHLVQLCKNMVAEVTAYVKGRNHSIS